MNTAGGSSGPRIELLPGTTLKEPRPRTLALDGAYPGFAFDERVDFVSLDHHAACVRLITRATCEQVRDVLRLHPRFLERFDTVVVNHLDADTVLSLYLIHRSVQGKGIGCEPHDRGEDLDALVRAVGAVDAVGSQVLPRLPLAERALVTEFHRRLRDRALTRKCVVAADVDHKLAVLDHLMPFVDELLGEARLPYPSVCAPSGAVRPLVTGSRFALAEAEGSGAMAALYAGGHDVGAVTTRLPTGRRLYTIGKMSDLGYGHVGSALEALKALEPGWGGSSSIGGSPRPHGSALEPAEVARVLARTL